jgi:cytochrome c556
MSGVFRAERKARIAVAVVAAVIASAAVAQSSPKDVIAARQQGLKDAGAAFKTIRDQMRGTPDAAAIKSAAQTIEQTAGKMSGWFPKGSGPEAGVKTGAKPEIWTDATGFDAAAKKFVEEAGKFNALAKAGDMKAVGAGVRALGQACGGCHDKYRVKED